MSSHNRTSADVEQKVLTLLQRGLSGRQVGRKLSINESVVRAIKRRADNQPKPEVQSVQYLDKKTSTFNWRDAIEQMKKMQQIYNDASWSQKRAAIKVNYSDGPIGVISWGDQHIGARGTDYNTFLELTDLLVNTPNLFAVLTGDVAEWAVKLRGVAEVCAQLIDPFLQVQFIEQWFDFIKHKVIASTWGNHTDDRSEAGIGTDPIKNIISKHVPYFSGIGHMNIQLGQQSYNIAVSHKFSGVTKLDSTAGCKKYMREQWNDADAAIQGDCHRAGIAVYNEGDKRRVAISNGTHHIQSGFAGRYFSIVTSQAMPVLTLWSNKKQLVPYFCVQEFLDSHPVTA